MTISPRLRIAVAGAGIYGATTAIKLAMKGFSVTVFDPLGILRAASSINQLRVHRGYHYPRSVETIEEILESRGSFIEDYSECIVSDTENYYAIPHEGSLTRPEEYVEVCDSLSLKLKKVTPKWINFDYIQSCFRVQEEIYDPDLMRQIIKKRFEKFGVRFERKILEKKDCHKYDILVYATYGVSGSHMYLFDKVQKQVAEKMLIKLPSDLKKKSLVVVDGPFTAFDPYGATDLFQFGSAKHTNHWISGDPEAEIPDMYQPYLNTREFVKVDFTYFDRMVSDCKLAVPASIHAEYIGSKFTIRLVEDDATTDRRILRIEKSDERTFHVFSGKVVGATKAAEHITNEICNM